ncbi:hypothetical protein AAG570_013779 [Ranatra chinensis]|uniref:Uncharacterized protein n=1 Tax=Ranatra chinensis TaxID=642074 RepID=A0ABD0YD65_9HEMI
MSVFDEGIKKLVPRPRKCIGVDGDNFEKWTRIFEHAQLSCALCRGVDRSNDVIAPAFHPSGVKDTGSALWYRGKLPMTRIEYGIAHIQRKLCTNSIGLVESVSYKPPNNSFFGSAWSSGVDCVVKEEASDVSLPTSEAFSSAVGQPAKAVIRKVARGFRPINDGAAWRPIVIVTVHLTRRRISKNPNDVARYFVFKSGDPLFFTNANADQLYFTEVIADPVHYTVASVDPLYYTVASADPVHYTVASVDPLYYTVASANPVHYIEASADPLYFTVASANPLYFTVASAERLYYTEASADPLYFTVASADPLYYTVASADPVHYTVASVDPLYYTVASADPVHYTEASADPVYYTVASVDPLYYTVASADPVHYTEASADPVYYTVASADPVYYTEASVDPDALT